MYIHRYLVVECAVSCSGEASHVDTDEFVFVVLAP